MRRAVIEPEAMERFDWSKTWVAEMLMSGEEAVKRAAEIDRIQGKTPEVKRRNEIKAGVITGSVGIALMITLFVLMNGIILGGVSDKAAEILSRVWIAGIIPLFVGIALIVNGVFISKKRDVPADRIAADNAKDELTGGPAEFIPPAKTNQLGSVPFSVTDETTQHLEEPLRRRPHDADPGR